ncbi:kinesin-like protein KIN-14B [Lycium ferocissimum]|uniref:kinesin-like protein KIN-14B n=1 Tax=Lycium ferocissimum TaxID=112874 RepID=UPI00281567FB|nr:kinesin-like protein KIN-14B [Lycium ferocissimum]XP_059288095.1 kinesin-like protein KIN-14B [Lycium ferocissimum]
MRRPENMKSMEQYSERSFDSLNESIHSLMGLKTHLTCNWVDSVRGIIKALQPQPSDKEVEQRQQQPDDNNNEDSNTAISKIKGELEVLDACIKKLNVQRRHILNELLDLKGNIRVFCRIRPISIASQKSVKALGSNEVFINLADNKTKSYSFDKVFILLPHKVLCILHLIYLFYFNYMD